MAHPGESYNIKVIGSTSAGMCNWIALENSVRIGGSSLVFGSSVEKTLLPVNPVLGDNIYEFWFRGIAGAHNWPDYTKVAITVIVQSVPVPNYFTVVPLDEFGQVTEALKVNPDDICYVELRGHVPPGYYWGAVKITTADADIISIEESYDYWYNGISLWWTTASSNPLYGGAGNLYNYRHIHSPDNDTYKSEGSSWAAAWQAEGQQYGYIPGPAGSLVNGAPVSEARFYYSGYLGNHSKERPGIRLGLRIKNPESVTFNIYSHDLFELNWSPEKFTALDIATVLVTPRVNYQSVHTEGNNVWIQVSGPTSANADDTVTISTYGELMSNNGLYNASLERTDTSGITTDLIRADGIIGNEFGPETASYPVTAGGEETCTGTMQDIGSVPEGNPQSVELKYNVEAITLDAIIAQLDGLLARNDIPDAVKAYLLTARDACQAMQAALALNPPN